MFKLEASILTPFQEITYPQMYLFLQNQMPFLRVEHHPGVPPNPLLINTIFTAGKRISNIKKVVM